MNGPACAGSLLATAILASAALSAHAQRWPERTARIVVATPPGGGDDFVVRLLAPKLSELLGQSFVAENRLGAGGVIAQNHVMKASPDGYTWLLAGASMAGARYVNAAAAYDVLRDFTPVSMLETSPFVLLVHLAVPARTAKDYVALARAQSGKITFATMGAGQAPYWSAHLFNSMAGIKALEVPYKSFGEAMSDLVAGRVDYFFAPSATAMAYRQKLRPLAVTTPTRAPALPDIPALAESALPGYDMTIWRSIVGPAGVPPDIVQALNAALARALASGDVREKLRTVGSEAVSSTPRELTERFALWIDRFGKIAQQAGIKPQ
ncbi:MAG: tripartite tricarboxylate transporter substrate binding protein [Betaproteobacteria bacterium]|nr:MAG: tripartite tricarboxylate transporter substrate binding protein [Betaproteobacteria bacterium]